MTWISAVILGILEGLTEFVPVSSTGHLILAKRFLQLHGDGVDAFLVVIQLGALCAAILYYRKILWNMLTGVISGKPEARLLFVALCLASAPLLLLGYLFGHQIKDRLFQPVSVSIALVAGGIVMMAMDVWGRYRKDVISMKDLSMGQVFMVGIAQAFALIPGTSRSMSCMIGGQIVGLDRVSAADFAFLLAIPTLGVATVYELIKSRHEIAHHVGVCSLLIGLSVSFVVGWLVIAGFLRYLKRFGFFAFGVYRVALGVLMLTVEWFL